MRERKRSGNPRAWEPLTIAPALDTREDGRRPLGMAETFYASSGRGHWYAYREPQRAFKCLAFGNRLYNGWALEFEDGSMHLTFKRNDRAAVRDWRHFQAIKNEVAGPEREAMELFPPESMLVDTANEYHLWVLPEGMGVPLGFAKGVAVDSPTTHDHALYRETGRSGAGQRPWEPGIPTGPGVTR